MDEITTHESKLQNKNAYLKNAYLKKKKKFEGFA